MTEKKVRKTVSTKRQIHMDKKNVQKLKVYAAKRDITLFAAVNMAVEAGLDRLTGKS